MISPVDVISVCVVASPGQRGQSLHGERGHPPDHHGPPDQVTHGYAMRLSLHSYIR